MNLPSKAVYRLLGKVLPLFLSLVVMTAHADDQSVIDRLSNGTPQEIAHAVQSLDAASLNRDDVIGKLISMLDDKHNDPSLFPTHFEPVQHAVERKLMELSADSILSVARRLSELEGTQISTALHVIEHIGTTNKEAYDLVLPYCRSQTIHIRKHAILALSSLSDDSDAATQQFIKFLHDVAAPVRWTALEAIDKRGGRLDLALPDIIGLLDDETVVDFGICFSISYKLCGRAARSLVHAGTDASAALPRLRQLIKPGYDDYVRVWSSAAICAISPTAPDDALDLLRGYLQPDRYDATLDSLGLMSVNSVKIVAPSNDAPTAMANLGTKAISLLDDLDRAKLDPSPGLREQLPSAFFAVDPSSAVQRILPMIEDQEPDVTTTAIQELDKHRVSQPEVVDAYIRSLGRLGVFMDSPAESAVNALANLGNAAKPAIHALEKLANQQDIPDSLREKTTSLLKSLR